MKQAMGERRAGESRRTRGALAAYAVVGAVLLGGLLVAVRSGGGGRRLTVNRVLGNPPGAVDRLVMMDSAEAWGRGSFDRCAVEAGQTPRMILRGGKNDYPREG